MATAVTICNLALSRIGDEATISNIDPPDRGSEQAEACSRIYPVALSSILDLFDWSFAMRRADLPQLAEGSVELGPWRYAYGLPADCKRVVDIHLRRETGGSSPAYVRRRPGLYGDKQLNEPPKEFEVVGTDTGSAILSDVPLASVRYVCSSPNPSQFTGLFVDSLAWLLASYLAGETIRGDSAHAYAQNCQKQFQVVVTSAMAQDARQNRVRVNHIPSWIQAR